MMIDVAILDARAIKIVSEKVIDMKMVIDII